MAKSIRILVLAAAVAAAAATAGAQPSELRGTMNFIAGEIPLGPIVKGAPFCADGTTTSSQTLGDGTKISRTGDAI